MKIHKVSKDRIFFITDSSAYGSILKDDVKKLVTALDIPEGKIDARLGNCMTDNFVPVKFEPSYLVADCEYGDLITKAEYELYKKQNFLEGTAYPSDGVNYWKCPVWEKEYSHVLYFSK